MTAEVQVLREGALTSIVLDRPARAHAYTQAMLEAIEGGIGGRVILVRSTGERAFCAGADLDEMRHAEPLDALDLRSQRVFARLASHTAISIAVIQGAAVAGGCELALACDFRVAGPKARFSLPETGLGLIPSAGGCTRLPPLIGPSRARRMVLLGEVVHADTALDWGLVDAVVEDPLATARAWAERLLARDAVALRLAKQVLEAPSLERERVAESLLYLRRRRTLG